MQIRKGGEGGLSAIYKVMPNQVISLLAFAMWWILFCLFVALAGKYFINIYTIRHISINASSLMTHLMSHFCPKTFKVKIAKCTIKALPAHGPFFYTAFRYLYKIDLTWDCFFLFCQHARTQFMVSNNIHHHSKMIS